MASTTLPLLNGPSRATYSCIRCADRKVKCDRQRPCGACVKRNVECVFNPSPPTRKRQKRAKEEVLTERLKYYEALLDKQGIDPKSLNNEPIEKTSRRTSQSSPNNAGEVQLQTPSSINSDTDRCIGKTQIVHGHGRTTIVDK